MKLNGIFSTPDDVNKFIRALKKIVEQEGKTYPVATEDLRRLDTTFTYHAPKPDQLPRYTVLRQEARALALYVLQLCPPSRERSLALTKIEEAIMHANAAIARNE